MLIKTKLLFFLNIIILCLSLNHCLQASMQNRYPRACHAPRTELQKNLAAMKAIYGPLMRLIDDPFMDVVQRDISAKRAKKLAYQNFIQAKKVSARTHQCQRDIVELYQDWQRAHYILIQAFTFNLLQQNYCDLKQNDTLLRLYNEEKTAFDALSLRKRAEWVRLLPGSRTNNPYCVGHS